MTLVTQVTTKMTDHELLQKYIGLSVQDLRSLQDKLYNYPEVQIEIEKLIIELNKI